MTIDKLSKLAERAGKSRSRLVEDLIEEAAREAQGKGAR